MNQPQWAPPAPPKKRRRWPWIAAVAAAGIGIGAVAGGQTSTTAPPSTSSTTAATDPVADTDAPTTTEVRSIDAWLDEHAERVSTFADENYFILTSISDNAEAGDFVATRVACLDGVAYITGIQNNDFVTEGPGVFVDAIDAYLTAYTACSEGDFETATIWTERGTALIGELTDLID